MAEVTTSVKAKVAAPTIDQINADRITQVNKTVENENAFHNLIFLLYTGCFVTIFINFSLQIYIEHHIRIRGVRSILK